jgi:plastocyanin
MPVRRRRLVAVVGVIAVALSAVVTASTVLATAASSLTQTVNGPSASTTWNITVGPGGSFVYSPSSLTIVVGDAVRFTFASSPHTVTNGSDCVEATSPYFPALSSDATIVFAVAGTFPFFSAVDAQCQAGMQGVITVRTPDADLALTGVPADITTAATSASGAVVTFALPTATDEAGDTTAPSVSCDHPTGSTFPIGTTTVTCSASSTDDKPSTVQGSFTVTVNKAPTNLVAASARHGLLTITFSAILTRADTGAPLSDKTVTFSTHGGLIVFGGNPACSASTNSQGVASCTVLGLPIGSGTYTASFAGDATYQPSSSSARL